MRGQARLPSRLSIIEMNAFRVCQLIHLREQRIIAFMPYEEDMNVLPGVRVVQRPQQFPQAFAWPQA